MVVLVSWLVAMFAGFGMFAPNRATPAMAVTIGALVDSTAVIMMSERSRRLHGLISVSAEPLHQALAVMGKYPAGATAPGAVLGE